MYISRIKIGNTVYDIKAITGGTNTTYQLSVNGTANGDSANGVSLGTIYAPTTAGTSGQILTSTGGIPTWSAAPLSGVSQQDVLTAIYNELYGSNTKPSGATTVTSENLSTTLSGYQTIISDLATIRSGAALGATALLSYTELYTGTVTGAKVGENGELISPVNGILTLPENNGGASTYGDVEYTYAEQSTSGAITIDGTIPLHVITCTGNITGITLSNNPPAGHSCHVILTATTARTVAIAHNATDRKCPQAVNLKLSIKANGYVEVDFLNINDVIYVRGV